VVKFIWVFGDQLTRTIDNEKVIFARLGKIKRGFEDTIYDKEKRSFNRVAAESPRALDYSNFVIYPRHHLILFEERDPHISIDQFRKNFSEIYKRHFSDLSNVRIDPITRTREILGILKECDRIIEAKFELFQSNPTDEPEFRKLDRLLKESNAEKTTLKFTNKKEGLTLEGSVIKEGVFMAGSGYGEYRITVEKEGSKKEIKSRDEIPRDVVESNDEPDELVNKLWEKMKERVKRGDQLEI
jgi:hypothetical protein